MVDYRDFDNRVSWLGQYGHAWVEAYFEGGGWLCEATPGYHGNRYTAWPAPKSEVQVISSYYNKEKTNPYMEDQMDNNVLTYEN